MKERYTITVESIGSSLYIGLLDDSGLIEYQRFEQNEPVLLQKIVMGLITEPVGGLGSFFVNIHEDRPGFLQVEGPQKRKCGELLPVQIVREGTGRKGHLVTERYSIPGRCLVLTPFDRRISLSSKIDNPEDRIRLLATAAKLPYTEDTGYILRTDAVRHTEDAILAEAASLFAVHEEIQKKAKTAPVGTVLYQSASPLLRMLLSLPSGSIRRITVQDPQYAALLKERLMAVEEETANKVEAFEQGRWSIRDVYKLTSELERAMKRSVPLRDGGCIVIDETEAMTVIDVNSGGASSRDEREETLFQLNLRAAKEIAKQIRLRNLSGIIIVDFIDMKSREHKDALLNHMRQEVRKDPRKTTVHGLTHLGLMEISRQRGSLPLSKILTL